MTEIKLPLPKVNPETPHSIFHAVSVPPAVQEKSADVPDTLDVERLVGFKQLGASPINKSSTKISL